MSRHDDQTLINLARKSGLRTSEIYTALAARPSQTTSIGNADSNGFVPTLDSDGHRTFKPHEPRDE